LLQQAEALRDNLKACRHAAQQICRAGVKMPEALTALAAFNLKLFDAMQPADDSDNQQHSPARYKLEEVRCRSRSALISSIIRTPAEGVGRDSRRLGLRID
jgi:hypothetical protein